MRRKNNTPRGELISLADHIADRKKTARNNSDVPVRRPKDALPDDEFRYLPMSDNMRAWRVRKGDIVVIYSTLEVERGDYVVLRDLREPEGTDSIAGRFDFDECYYFLDHDCCSQCGTSELHRAHHKIEGRIVEVQRTGQTVEEIYQAFEQRQKEWRALREEEERNAPEPKDRLSSQWRYWKLIQMQEAFESDDAKTYSAAWREFTDLLKGLMADEDFWHVSNALPLLPLLIIARQDIDRLNKQERRLNGAMKATATRKARQQKRR
ncbi:MAG: hypothetical protein WBP93_05340 [Pyrinomonadaceae bacterium]